jgi:hypothetical protein
MHSQGCEKTGDWVAFRKESVACTLRFFAPALFQQHLSPDPSRTD